MTEQQLVDLKNKIDASKQKQSELKGKRKALIENLQNTWGCKTIEQAQKKIEQLKKEVEDLGDEIYKATKEIEENYDF